MHSRNAAFADILVQQGLAPNELNVRLGRIVYHWFGESAAVLAGICGFSRPGARVLAEPIDKFDYALLHS